MSHWFRRDVTYCTAPVDFSATLVVLKTNRNALYNRSIRIGPRPTRTVRRRNSALPTRRGPRRPAGGFAPAAGVAPTLGGRRAQVTARLRGG